MSYIPGCYCLCRTHFFTLAIPQIGDQENEDEYRKVLGTQECEFLLDCGVIFRAEIVDKEANVSAVCHHYLIVGIIAELEQLRKGLSTLNFLTLMEMFPKELMSIFSPSDAPLSADQLEDLFHIKYSEDGSNQRATEEQIVFNFFKFLRDIEEG